MPPLASLLEGDGMPEHVHVAFEKERALHAQETWGHAAPANSSAVSEGGAARPGSAPGSSAGSGADTGEGRKSLLRVQNSREARAAMAARKWDEVTTWNGDYDCQDSGAWGEVLFEAHSGMDVGVTVDVNADITVQVFPVYPFLQRPILQRRPVYDMRGCPTFVLWLPRDLNAHLFWKRRDLLAPFFWNSDGSPGSARFTNTAELASHA